MQPWRDYVEGMDHTFDYLRDAVRSDSEPSRIGAFITVTLGRIFAGMAIGFGLALGMAIARAGVGF